MISLFFLLAFVVTFVVVLIVEESRRLNPTNPTLTFTNVTTPIFSLDHVSPDDYAIEFGFCLSTTSTGDSVIITAPSDDYYSGAFWNYDSGVLGPRNSPYTGQTGANLGTGCYQTPSASVAFLGAPVEGTPGAVYYYDAPYSTITDGSNRIAPDDNINSAFFGFSIAASADGQTFVTGGPGDNFVKGAVWVYERSGANYTLKEPKITAPEVSAGSQAFGRVVAGSSTLSDVAISAPEQDSGAGAVFTYAGGSTLTYQQKLFPSGGLCVTDSFGSAMVMSADGSCIVAGSHQCNMDLGAMVIFEKDGTYSETAAFSYADFRLGYDFSVNDDCSQIIACKPTTEPGCMVFSKSGPAWTNSANFTINGIVETDQLVVSDQNADGSVVYVSAIAFNSRGAVWKYERS